jgi:hypothetical protein
MRGSAWPPEDMPPGEADRIQRIESELLRLAGGSVEFGRRMTALVRQAIDEVIDTRRSGRTRFKELESTEKAYIGVRTEILFRNEFSLERGALDVIIAGEDVDIKNTTRGQWMIPTHSVDKPCLLIKSEPESDPGICSTGLAIARSEYLNDGANQDKKKTFKAAHTNKIKWLFVDSPFPRNELERLSDQQKQEILLASSGKERVAKLFLAIQRTPIPRHIVEAVARQTDAAKRVRRNGGARDITEADGLYILSFDQQNKWIKALGLPSCTKGEFISIRPETDHETHIIGEMLKEKPSDDA